MLDIKLTCRVEKCHFIPRDMQELVVLNSYLSALDGAVGSDIRASLQLGKMKFVYLAEAFCRVSCKKPFTA